MEGAATAPAVEAAAAVKVAAAVEVAPAAEDVATAEVAAAAAVAATEAVGASHPFRRPSQDDTGVGGRGRAKTNDHYGPPTGSR